MLGQTYQMVTNFRKPFLHQFIKHFNMSLNPEINIKTLMHMSSFEIQNEYQCTL